MCTVTQIIVERLVGQSLVRNSRRINEINCWTQHQITQSRNFVRPDKPKTSVDTQSSTAKVSPYDPKAHPKGT